MVNGDWEHTYGVSIENIDNPGWSLKVELIDTTLHDVEFSAVHIQRDSESDWVNCKVSEGVFQGYGGPLNLKEMIEIFMEWSDENV